MNTLYKCFALVLALFCYDFAVASSSSSSPPPPPVEVTSVTTSGTATSRTVCRNTPFTATANLSSTVRDSDQISWGVAIGTVTAGSINGVADFVTIPQRTVTVSILRSPGGSGTVRLTAAVVRNGVEITGSIGGKSFTVLADTPATPTSISADSGIPGLPGNNVVCQNSTVTYSVPATAGAIQYLWTAKGSTTTTSSPSFSTSFPSVGTQTVSVRTRGCGGSTSGSRSVTFQVLSRNDSPCNSNTFVRAASPSVSKQSMSNPSEGKLSVSTYPNPVVNELNIDVSSDYLSSTAQLINQETGESVKSFTILGAQSTIDTRDLPKGTYLLKMSNQQGGLTRRLIIE